WRLTSGRGCRWRRGFCPGHRASETAPPGRHRSRRRHLNWRPGRDGCTAPASAQGFRWRGGVRYGRRLTGSSEHLLGNGNQMEFGGVHRATLAAFLDEMDIRVTAFVIDEGAETL